MARGRHGGMGAEPAFRRAVPLVCVAVPAQIPRRAHGRSVARAAGVRGLGGCPAVRGPLSRGARAFCVKSLRDNRKWRRSRGTLAPIGTLTLRVLKFLPRG